MGRSCSMHEMYLFFFFKKRLEIDHSEDLDVDGRIILEWIFLRKK
jgi:hypothetical protein